MWMWNDGEGCYRFSIPKPEKAKKVNVFHKVKIGDIIPPAFTYCVSVGLLIDVVDLLPKPGELIEKNVHELWSVAVGKPNYDKKLWCQIAGAVNE